MLNPQDRVFQNLHGQDDAFLEGDLTRGSWSNTKEILSKDQNEVIELVNLVNSVVEAGRDFLRV